jgi:hypothetical protein
MENFQVETEIKDHTYIRRHIDDGQIVVYAHTSVEPTAIISRLVRGYQPDAPIKGPPS